ncbi:MAG TPA: NUDIX hydrolase [Bryobacteraceae bacterium]|nr:NUDIX hydrolase [Bryobacteraceae bacterium]
MKLISSKEITKNRIFRVTLDHAVAPGGFEIKRAIVQHRGSAVMMPVDENDRILLVRQYRLPARRYLWELPAGTIDDGETALQTARRELAEETGYRAKKWRKLAEFFPSPGFLSEKMTIYLATGLTAGAATPMEDERIEARWFTSKQIDDMVRAGKILDAKTNIGFLKWKRYFAGR